MMLVAERRLQARTTDNHFLVTNHHHDVANRGIPITLDGN